MSAQPLLPTRFLFRFAAPCRYAAEVRVESVDAWLKEGTRLSERHRLPTLDELDGREAWAELRAGWSEAGLALALVARGKRQPPRCDAERPWESDGLQFWLDTRDTHNVHRATRFCHQFVALPSGGGRRRTEPLFEQFFINRAKEHARRANPGETLIRAETLPDGYRLEVFLRAVALGGFDPEEHPRLGFTYAVLDQERGEQTFSCPPGLPFRDDPSLWGTLELVRE